LNTIPVLSKKGTKTAFKILTAGQGLIYDDGKSRSTIYLYVFPSDPQTGSSSGGQLSGQLSGSTKGAHSPRWAIWTPFLKSESGDSNKRIIRKRDQNYTKSYMNNNSQEIFETKGNASDNIFKYFGSIKKKLFSFECNLQARSDL